MLTAGPRRIPRQAESFNRDRRCRNGPLEKGLVFVAWSIAQLADDADELARPSMRAGLSSFVLHRDGRAYVLVPDLIHKELYLANPRPFRRRQRITRSLSHPATTSPWFKLNCTRLVLTHSVKARAHGKDSITPGHRLCVRATCRLVIRQATDTDSHRRSVSLRVIGSVPLPWDGRSPRSFRAPATAVFTTLLPE